MTTLAHALRRTRFAHLFAFLLAGAFLAGCGILPTPTSPTVNSVAIDGGDFDLQVGTSTTLTATVDVSDGASQEVTWSSSNASVATVDPDTGDVTAQGAAGQTADITATSDADGSVSDTVTVTLTAAPAAVESVTIDSGDFDLQVGTSATLTATVTPPDAPQGVTWSSSDDGVATVDPDTGDVTARGAAGQTADITATSDADGAISATATVTLTAAPVAVESVTIDSGDVDLQVGTSTTLAATVTPPGAPQGVTWSSSDGGVATVDPDTGEVTAQGAVGETAEITATSDADDTVSATVTVTLITDATVDAVTIEGGNFGLQVGTSTTLAVTVDVTAGASQDVTWSTSDPSVAAVDPDTGEVTAQGIAGQVADITATSDADGTVSDTVRVTLTAAPAAVASVTIDGGDFSLQVGTTTTLSATVAPVDAPQGVTWSSSDDGVATVDPDTGLVTAQGAAGQTADITATSDADGTLSDTVTVTLPSADAPAITAFDSVIVAGSEVQLTWSAERADTYDIVALIDGGGTATIASPVGTSVTLPIPASDQQTLRLVATNGDGQDTATLTLSNVVTSTADYDPYPLLGYEPEDPLPGTLRDVIANAPSDSVVGFASDIATVVIDGVDIESVPDLTAADAHLIFRGDVTVSGPPSGVTIEGASNCPDCTNDDENFVWRSRLVLVPPGSSVTLENLTLTGGTFIFSGGGIQNYGTLTLDNVEVTGNRSFGRGGGIHNKDTGDLTIVDSSIVNNRSVTLEDEIDEVFYIRNDLSAEVDFPGANGSGGAIYNDFGGSVSIVNSVIGTNEARVSGGGIYNMGLLDVVGTNVNDNDADHNVFDATDPDGFSYGGGIYNDGEFTFDGGDIDGNVAASQGGGLYHDVNGFSTLTNVLIQGNLAGTLGETGYGGGVMHNHYTGEEARLSLPPSPYGPGNAPQDILVSDRGPRPSELRLAPSSTLPSGGDPDDRNK